MQENFDSSQSPLRRAEAIILNEESRRFARQLDWVPISILILCGIKGTKILQKPWSEVDNEIKEELRRAKKLPSAILSAEQIPARLLNKVEGLSEDKSLATTRQFLLMMAHQLEFNPEILWPEIALKNTTNPSEAFSKLQMLAGPIYLNLAEFSEPQLVEEFKKWLSENHGRVVQSRTPHRFDPAAWLLGLGFIRFLAAKAWYSGDSMEPVPNKGQIVDNYASLVSEVKERKNPRAAAYVKTYMDRFNLLTSSFKNGEVHRLPLSASQATALGFNYFRPN